VTYFFADNCTKYFVAQFWRVTRVLYDRWLQVHAESHVCSEQTGLLLSH